MPASGRCLTKVKQPNLDMRFWWAVLPGRGGQPVLLLATQLVVLSTGNSSNITAMTMSSSRCSPWYTLWVHTLAQSAFAL